MRTTTFIWEEFLNAGGIPRLAEELRMRGVSFVVDNRGLTLELEEGLSIEEGRKMVEDHMATLCPDSPGARIGQGRSGRDRGLTRPIRNGQGLTRRGLWPTRRGKPEPGRDKI